MILVTIGTSEPFDRLLRVLETPARTEEMVVQCGSSTVHPLHATCVPYLEFDDLVDYMRRSRVVVMHAGAGSVLAALAVGRRPIVVPRLRRYAEAVDDHQLDFARKLESIGLVTLVEDPVNLPRVLATAPEGGANGTTLSSGRLARELRAYLGEQVGRTNARAVDLG